MIRSKSFKLISPKDNKLLPEDVWEWVHVSKREMGSHTFEHGNKRYYVIALGERPNPGHQIELTKVEETDQKIIAEVEETLPSRGGFYPQVIAYPYLVAEVQKPLEVTVSVKWPSPSIFSLKSP